MSRRHFTRKLLITVVLLVAFSGIVITQTHPIGGQVTYIADWSTEGITRITASGGWQTVNDLGYTVRVTKGYVVSAGATMVACEHLPGAWDWLLSVLSPTVIKAGHSGDVDPAAIRLPQVESVVTLQPMTLDSLSVQEFSYCQGHYVIAAANERAVNLPADQEMVGASLFLEGTYQRAGQPATTFSIKTRSPNGLLFNLTATNTSEARHLVMGQASTVTIRRNAARLFDGVNFAEMDDEARAQAILDSLLTHAQMLITDGKIR
jgi:hypothetical protein